MTDGTLDFDEALTVRTVGDGHLMADIAHGWDVRGNPHGGYLLALAAAAMGHIVRQPDPLSIAATYLAPPRVGRAELFVEVVRAGKRQSTAQLRLIQDDEERLRATATFGVLADQPATALAADVVAPKNLPAPELCLPASALEQAEGEPINLHDRLELRFGPATGWLTGRPRGVAEVDGWLRFKDGRPVNALALLMFSDGFPPSVFEQRGRGIGHVPTVQLTTHLFGRPAPGWIQARFRSRVQGGNFLDEDGELWDSDGNLVATTRQLALVRSTTSPAGR